MKRFLYSVLFGISFAAPVTAQQELVCAQYDPRVEAAFEMAMAGNPTGAVAELRTLSQVNDPELLRDIARRALNGLPQSNPLLVPDTDLAVAALERALEIEGAHLPGVMFLLSEISRDTGIYSEQRQAELRNLAASFGYDRALIDMARQLVAEEIDLGPDGNFNRLQLLLSSVNSTESTDMVLFLLELMEREETSDLLSIDRGALIEQIVDRYERDFEAGKTFAAATLASTYVRGALVEQDLDLAREWLEKIRPCWRGSDYRLMGTISILSDPDDTETATEYFRQAAERGSIGGALDLARMRIDFQAREVSNEEAILWLDRAVQLNDLRAALLWVNAHDVDETFPNYDPSQIGLLIQNAETTWRGDGAQARMLGQIFAVISTPWYSEEMSKEWFRRAAMAGDASGMREHGKSLLATNRDEAIEWILRAIAAGSTPALVDMADILLAPPTSPEDTEQARVYLQRAVDKGSLSALTRLAAMYLDENGLYYDRERGLSLLENAAVQGSASAQTRLAQLLLDQALTADPVEAALLRDRAGRYLVQASNSGSLSAKHMIANLILLETDEPEDVARALDFLEQAANGGRVSAIIDLAEYYISVGELETAVEYYRRAADLGSVRATMELARAYSAGLGVPQDVNQSLAWLRRAELMGEQDVRTLRQLATGFLNGQFGPPDVERAVQYYLSAAELGDPSSMMILANMYHEGTLIEYNEEAAFRWALRAAEQGSVSGMVFVGEAYNEGLGTEVDTEEAVKWMQAALDTNPDNATAALAIGRAYQLGIGFEPDATRALEYYERAANLGNISAMVRTARSYLQGIGIKSTPEVAVEWYDRAARTGNVTAMLELAQLHAMGYGTPLDSERAFELYSAAANSGSSIGMRETARLYFAGVGTQRNVERGVELLERAARQGDLGAMRDIWVLYSEGFELEPDEEYALFWLYRAAEGGHHQANLDIAHLMYDENGGVMTPEIKAMIEYANEAVIKDARLWLQEIYAEEERLAAEAAEAAQAAEREQVNDGQQE